MSEFWSGYAIEKEDHSYLKANSTDLTSAVMSYSIPDMVDPWVMDKDCLPTEDQLQIGACQGNALSECLEYAFRLVNGENKQFSRIFAYLGSQKMDGISGDSGSTLSGGTKLLREYGCCPESVLPYPRSYPNGGSRWIPQEAWEAAKQFKLKSYTDMQSSDDVRQYIGSGQGIVQIGIRWSSSFSPDSNGCIRSFNVSGGGGHSVVFCGYVPDDIVKQKSTKGWWAILKNSWGNRWGIRGRAFVDPAVIDQMIRDRYTTMLGRTDLDAPSPRPVPIDFTKPGKSLYYRG